MFEAVIDPRRDLLRLLLELRVSLLALVLLLDNLGQVARLLRRFRQRVAVPRLEVLLQVCLRKLDLQR